MHASKAIAAGAGMLALCMGLCFTVPGGAGAATPKATPKSTGRSEASAPAIASAKATGKQPGGPAKIRKKLKVHGVRNSGNTAWSSNWSGYVDTNENYTYVFGQWTVPSANCGPWYDFNFSQSSTWVGLDGWGDNTVEQLGTTSGCIAGVSAYYAWTEMYPSLPYPILHTISPGDTMEAFVYSYDAGTEYELYIWDITKGWNYETTDSSSPADSDLSAEWITERPSCGPPCNNLTNFGTTTFQDAYAIGNNYFGTISSFPYQAIDMDNGNLEAAVGNLGGNGSTFTDWFEHS